MLCAYHAETKGRSLEARERKVTGLHEPYRAASKILGKCPARRKTAAEGDEPPETRARTRAAGE